MLCLLATAVTDLRDQAVDMFSLETIEVAAVTILELATFSQHVSLSLCVHLADRMTSDLGKFYIQS